MRQGSYLGLADQPKEAFHQCTQRSCQIRIPSDAQIHSQFWIDPLYRQDILTLEAKC
jgi:hypothetical protein